MPRSNARHIFKATPFAPISWIADLVRSAGGDTSGLDRFVNSLLGKYSGSNLTGAEQEANTFNAAEAEKNRTFEERMSNTTYQRTVADMQSAGLNPSVMLAGSAGAVTTPSGSTASSVSPAGGSLSDLMSVVALPFQLANLQAQTHKTEREAGEEIPAKVQQMLSAVAVNKANAAKLHLESDAQAIVNSYLDEQQKFYTVGLSLSNDKVQQEINESFARVENLDNQNRELLQKIAESQQRVSLLLAQESLTESETAQVYETIKYINENTKKVIADTALTQKDVNWYTANHISNMVGDAGSLVGSILGGLGNIFRRAPKFAPKSYHDPFGYMNE